MQQLTWFEHWLSPAFGWGVSRAERSCSKQQARILDVSMAGQWSLAIMILRHAKISRQADRTVSLRSEHEHATIRQILHSDIVDVQLVNLFLILTLLV